MVDHIPVIWFEPQERQAVRRLAMFVPPFSGTKENMAPYLQDLAAAGYIALSLDAWQHGERSTEPTEELQARVFGNFRRYMWPIIGQTTLDVLKIIDWAISSLGVEEHIRLGGLSMGGDISVAAAGLDQRIERVAAVVATPDWQRPGMQDLFKPGTLLPQGEPDAYARYFYDHLNPLTHLAAFAHGPAINFICGAEDTHVPPDGAQRFQAALREISPTAADNIHIQLLPGMGHMDFVSPQRWWPNCLTWLTEA
jgi:dienelactone hydrolase